MAPLDYTENYNHFLGANRFDPRRSRGGVHLVRVQQIFFNVYSTHFLDKSSAYRSFSLQLF